MVRYFFSVVLCAATLFAAGCTTQQNADSTQKIKEGAASATAVIKKDTTAVVQGVQEGWNRDKNGPLDLNSATKSQLVSLPGISGAEADAIISNRPYKQKQDLVAKGVLSQRDYNRIADSVTAK